MMSKTSVEQSFVSTSLAMLGVGKGRPSRATFERLGCWLLAISSPIEFIMSFVGCDTTIVNQYMYNLIMTCMSPDNDKEFFKLHMLLYFNDETHTYIN